MGTLIFDIETVGESWDDFDETTKTVLTSWAKRSSRSESEYDSLVADIRAGLGFSPLTGKIVSVGIYDLERKQGAVYYTPTQSTEDIEAADGEFVFKACTEKELLEDFWEGAKSYDTFVSFNGRSFDVPFLLHRSVSHQVMPTVNLLSHRYLNQQHPVYHIDLLDQLTFYGAMARRPSLHLFCRTYGIPSPKALGMTGEEVQTLYQTGAARHIAHYNSQDVIATKELYSLWLKYLAPEEFLNRYLGTQ